MAQVLPSHGGQGVTSNQGPLGGGRMGKWTIGGKGGEDHDEGTRAQ